MAKKSSRKKKGGTMGVQVLREHARGVMAALGKGQTERVYHRAMITSLNKKKVQHRSEVLAPIVFLGEVVGFGRCDLIIGDLVVELKANAQCPSKASPQLCKYMASMGATERKKFRGVVVNFNKRSGAVEIMSKIKQQETNVKKRRK
jgi:GxxExxY protein